VLNPYLKPFARAFKTTPIPAFPLKGPAGTLRAVDNAEGNQGFPPRLLSLKPTPTLTLPLMGRELQAQRACKTLLPLQGEGRDGGGFWPAAFDGGLDAEP
jgi:hypothetical protein